MPPTFALFFEMVNGRAEYDLSRLYFLGVHSCVARQTQHTNQHGQREALQHDDGSRRAALHGVEIGYFYRPARRQRS